MPLHADTVEFLKKRNEWRDELAKALRGDVEPAPEPEPETDPEPTPEPEPDEEDPNDSVNEGTEEDECEVEGRTEENPDNPENPNPCVNVVDRLSELRPLECFQDPKGWPNSDKLYTDLNEMLKRAQTNPRTTDTQAEIIRLQRQINLLESYRKMLLHKKQRACHYLESWCRCLQDEARSQKELEAHLNWEPVGLTKPS